MIDPIFQKKDQSQILDEKIHIEIWIILYIFVFQRNGKIYLTDIIVKYFSIITGNRRFSFIMDVGIISDSFRVAGWI